MQPKDAPELNQIKLTAGSEVEEVDDVVHPFVPKVDAESEKPTSKPMGITSFGEREASAGRIKLSQQITLARRFSIVLGVVLAASLCAIMWKQRQAAEEQLHYYNDQAELAEYDHKQDKAALLWRKAIKLSESLHSDSWAVADLHMRAAIAERDAARLIPPGANDIPPLLVRKFNADEKEDLLTALHIYQHTNAKAEQQMVLKKLVETCDLTQCVYYDAYRDPLCNKTTITTDAFAAEQSLKKPDKNDIDKTVANYKMYLLKGGEISFLSEDVNSLLGFLETPQQYAKVIPLLQEYVYRAIEPENFLQGHKWLDQAIEKSGKSKDASGRLVLANDAYAHGDFHGAIVEYSRYLADNKKDAVIREKLLEARRQNRQSSIGSRADTLLEEISYLKQLRDLQQEIFGYENPLTMRTTLCLAADYSLDEDVQSAEQELLPLLKIVKKRIPLKYVPVDFTATVKPLGDNEKDANNFATITVEEAADIFRTSAGFATQKAMYESAVRDLEYSALATGWPACKVAKDSAGAYSLRFDRWTFANLCTCRGLYNMAQHHLPPKGDQNQGYWMPVDDFAHQLW